MGGRLSPIIANVYMEDLEFHVLSTSLTIPRLNLWYVDDIVIVWSLENGDFDPFLDSLNSVHPDIHLMVEEETDRVLPFLDVEVKRLETEDGQMELSIFRKPTHCDRYLQFQSAHPVPVKRATV